MHSTASQTQLEQTETGTNYTKQETARILEHLRSRRTPRASSIPVHKPQVVQTDDLHDVARDELSIVKTCLIVPDMRELVEELTDEDDGRISIDYL